MNYILICYYRKNVWNEAGLDLDHVLWGSEKNAEDILIPEHILISKSKVQTFWILTVHKGRNFFEVHF